MKILIATHGKFASGVKSAADMLTGNGELITCVDAYIQTETGMVRDEDIPGILERFFEGIPPEEDVVVFADLKGGSVNNRLIQLMPKGRRVHLIAGFNLPLVLEIVMEERSITKELLEETIQFCKQEMVLIPPIWEGCQEGEGDGDFFE